MRKCEKSFFSQNGSREWLNSSKESETLWRCHTSKQEHVVETLWAKLFKFLDSSKKCLKSPENTQTFFKVLACLPMMHISQSQLSECQKFPKDAPNLFQMQVSLKNLLIKKINPLFPGIWKVVEVMVQSVRFILGMQTFSFQKATWSVLGRIVGCHTFFTMRNLSPNKIKNSFVLDIYCFL